MKLVSFLEPGIDDLVWFNPETVCFVRKTTIESPGKTMIGTMGGTFYVRAEIETVVDRLRRPSKEE